MSGPPPKRFRQTTISDGFKRQCSFKSPKSSSNTMPQVSKEANKEVAGIPSMATKDDKHEKLVLTSEERRNSKSPVMNTVPPIPSCSIGSQHSNKNLGSVTDNGETIPEKVQMLNEGVTDSLENDNSLPLFDSQELVTFEDDDLMSQCAEMQPSQGQPWKGIPELELKRIPHCRPELPKPQPTKMHAVLIKLPIIENRIPDPYPSHTLDVWDAFHVKMPCSAENLYPVEDEKGKKHLKNRWELIENALKSDICSSLDLEEAILTYNSKYSQRWDFRGLHTYFTEECEAEEARSFFTQTLPKIIDLALQLPYICTQPIPLLQRGSAKSVTLSQKQIASLLANAFLCTFPRRNTTKNKSEYSSYPEINFNRLFQGSKDGGNPRKIEKLKCIFNYFRRVTTNIPTGTVTFSRQVLKTAPSWERSGTRFTNLHVTTTGTIETEGFGMLQVDFANKFLGGGVLGNGLVQEEIRFMICPEMIASMLFTEVLADNESLLMIGCEQFNKYEGYSNSFRWAGNYIDESPRDSWGRCCTEVVAIDALVVRKFKDQFDSFQVRRELNKAYCGFARQNDDKKHLPAVATGNWGCGAFGGDFQLKALIQFIAASEAGRDLCYFTFGDTVLRDSMALLYNLINEKSLAVDDLVVLIEQYSGVLSRTNKKSRLDLYDYIHSVYNNDSEDSTDEDTTTINCDDSSVKDSPNYSTNTL